jgi:hypothetical protein
MSATTQTGTRRTHQEWAPNRSGSTDPKRNPPDEREQAPNRGAASQHNHHNNESRRTNESRLPTEAPL